MSSGFELEATHITQFDPLETLLGIVTISCCFAYLVGIYYIKGTSPKLNKLKNHAYDIFNTVRYGLGLLLDTIKGRFLEVKKYY